MSELLIKIREEIKKYTPDNAHITKLLEELSEDGTNTDLREYNEPILIEALENTGVDEEVIAKMIERGVSVIKKDSADRTALHVAFSQRRSMGIIKLLIDNNVDIKALNCVGQTAAFHLIPILYTRDYADLARVYMDILIENGSGLNDYYINRDDKKITILMKAVSSDRLELVEYLTGKGADVNVENEEGMTALDIAVKAGELNPGMVSLLLKYGAVIHDVYLDNVFNLYHANDKKIECQKLFIDCGVNLLNLKIKGQSIWDYNRQMLINTSFVEPNYNKVCDFVNITAYWLGKISKSHGQNLDALIATTSYIIDRSRKAEGSASSLFTTGYPKITKVLTALKLLTYQILGNQDQSCLSDDEKGAITQGGLGERFAKTGLRIDESGKLSGSTGIMLSMSNSNSPSSSGSSSSSVSSYSGRTLSRSLVTPSWSGFFLPSIERTIDASPLDEALVKGASHHLTRESL